MIFLPRSLKFSASCVLIATLQIKSYTSAGCVEEFGPCVMNRDCCEGMKCITGDWQYTTDSTCLSNRSEQIDNLNLTTEERIDVVLSFYSNKGVISKLKEQEKGKSRTDVEKIVKRYIQDFPKLVSRLEKKYDVQFEFTGVEWENVSIEL